MIWEKYFFPALTMSSELRQRRDMCVLLTEVPLATSDMPRYTAGAQCWGVTVQDVEPPYRILLTLKWDWELWENSSMTHPPQDQVCACCGIKNRHNLDLGFWRKSWDLLGSLWRLGSSVKESWQLGRWIPPWGQGREVIGEKSAIPMTLAAMNS